MCNLHAHLCVGLLSFVGGGGGGVAYLGGYFCNLYILTLTVILVW